MNKAMVVALAATVLLLSNPLTGFARNSHSQGSHNRGQSSYGAAQHGSQPRGSYSRAGSGQSGYRGEYRHGGYRYGGYPSGGYRQGGYPSGGYRYGGYPYRGYRYGGYYPYYRSNYYYSGGIWIGPGWGPWWGAAWPYYYPYYSYPYYSTPPVVIQQSPSEYIQRDQQPAETEYWYYCPNPKGYYPDIQRCPNGWIKLAPSEQPPSSDEPPAQ